MLRQSWMKKVLQFAGRPSRVGTIFHRKNRTLSRFEMLEDRVVPASVVWTGLGNDLNWNDPTNWSGGSGVPAPGDQVTINQSGITIVESGQAVSIGSIQSAASIVIANGGSLTVTLGTSQISAALTLQAGSSLTATGAGTTFIASGSSVIDGASLEAQNSATLGITGVTSYANEVDYAASLEASGAGSVLSLPGLTTMTATNDNDWGIDYWSLTQVEALAGGDVEAPALAQITGGPIQLISDGTGSVLNVSALSSFSQSPTGQAYYSLLQATNSGTIGDANLTTLSDVNLTVESAGTFSYTQLSQFTGAVMSLSAGAYTFSSLAVVDGSSFVLTSGLSLSMPVATSAINASVVISGGSLYAPDLSDIDDASFIVSGGSTVSLPSVTSYANEVDYTTMLEASGAGSVLDLPGLTSMTATNDNTWGVDYNSLTQVEALAGGDVEMPAVAQISGGPIWLISDGAGSVLDVSALSSFSQSPTGQRYFSLLQATDSGTIDDAKLTTLSDVNLILDGTGTFSYSQLAQFTSATMTLPAGTYTLNSLAVVDGSSFVGVGGGLSLSLPVDTSANSASFVVGSGLFLSMPEAVSAINASFVISGGSLYAPDLSDIDDVSVVVSDGSTVSLPSVTSYANEVDYTTMLEATGAGSLLSLPGLASMTATNDNTWGVDYNSLTQVEALAGGDVETPTLSQISGGPIWLISDGAGSILDVSALSSFSQSPTGQRYFSLLQATDSGTIDDAKLTTLSDVNLILDGTGTFSYSQLTQFTSATMTLAAGTYNFNSLAVVDGSSFVGVGGGLSLSLPVDTSANSASFVVGSGLFLSMPEAVSAINASFVISGGSLYAPDLSDIDDASVVVSDGSTVSLPSVTSYANEVDYTTMLEATGAGSVLSLPGLASMTATNDNTWGVDYNSLTQVEALAGGDVEMPALAQISGGPIWLISDGAGSVLDVSALSSFSQSPTGQRYFSLLQATDSGTIDDAKLTTLSDVNLTLDGTGTFSYSQLTQFTGATMTLATGTYNFSSLAVVDGSIFVGVAGVIGNGLFLSMPEAASASNASFVVSGGSLYAPDLSDIDDASVVVSDGSTVSLPSVTSYANEVDYTTMLEATGAGSVLSLPGLASMTATNDNTWGVDYNSLTQVEALAGGDVEMPALAQISGGPIWLISDGAGSVLDVSALSSFSQSPTGQRYFSLLQATDSGTIDDAKLTTLAQVNLTLDGTGTFSYSQITQFTGGAMTLPAGAYTFNSLVIIDGSGFVGVGDGLSLSFPVVTSANYVSFVLTSGLYLSMPEAASATNSSFVVSGGTLYVPELADIDSTSFVVSNGSTVSLPSVTSYANEVDYTTMLEATGVGSILSLPGLTSMTATTDNDWGIDYASLTQVEALAGGEVEMPVLAHISGGPIQLISDGAGSVLNVSALGSFSARNTGQQYGSMIQATNTGTIDLTKGTLGLMDSTVNITPTASLIIGTLNVGAGANLTGVGTLTGNVVNSGFVTPANQITIAGTYTQTAVGSLIISLGGLNAVTQYTQLIVTGTAALGGTLSISLANHFTPSGGNTFQVMTFGSITSYFNGYSGLNLGNGLELDPGLTTTALMLTTDPAVNIAITTSPQSIYPGQASQPITLQLLNQNGNPTQAGSGGVLVILNTSSSFGQFLSMNGQPLGISAITIPAGSGTISFEYQDSFVGTPTITAIAPSNSTQSQQETILQPALPAQLSAVIDPASDTGAPDHSGYTNIQTPSFDLQVNEAGTITVDFDGIPVHDQTLNVYAAGTYTFTAPTLSAGSYTLSAIFHANGANSVEATVPFTVETARPYITGFAPSGTLNTAFSQAIVTFSEPVDLGTFNASAITFTGPSGAIAVNAEQFLSGTSYSISFPTQSTQGTYTLVVANTVTDYAGNLLDQNQNGTGMGFSTTFNMLLPDLHVTGLGLTYPANPRTGDQVAVTWDDSDAGAAPTTASWQDSVTVLDLNTGRILVTGTVSYNATQNGNIAPGGQAAQSYSFLVPGGIPETDNIQVTVLADSNHSMTEASTTDKTAYTTFTATLTSPDLVVGSLSMNPSSTQSGNTITINWDDNNIGDGAATESFSDQIRIVNLTTGQTILNTTIGYNESTSGIIDAGGSAAQSYNFGLPNGSAGTGNLQITVTTDSADTVPEYNAAGNPYANNTSSITATSTLAPYPYLQVEGLAVGSSSVLQSGGMLNINWNDANTGDAPISKPWYDQVEIVNTTTGEILVDANVYSNAAAGNPVEPGNILPHSYSFGLPNGHPGAGSLAITITTDIDNNILKYNSSGTVETNSSASLDTTSGLAPYPDLMVSNVSAPAAVIPGQQATVSWSLANNGTAAAIGQWTEQVLLATDAAGDNQTLLEALPYAGQLGAGQEVSRSVTVQIPNEPAGNYWLVISENPFGEVFETNTSNNIAIATQPSNIEGVLTLSLAKQTVSDGAGAAATTANLIRNTNTTNALVVTLADNSASISIPQTVTIPAGQKSVTFFIGTINSGIAIGPQSATITASASGVLSGSDTFTVTDVNVPTLTVVLGNHSLNEDSANPAATGTITRNTPTGSALVVSLVSSAINKLTVPTNVTIPAGQASATFPVTVVDDYQIDGNTTATVTAASTGFVSGTDSAIVIDDNIPTLGLSLAQKTVSEAAGSNATTGTITIPNPASEPLTIALTSSDTSAATVPSTVVINTGQVSTTFPVTAINDGLDVGNQTAIISANVETISGKIVTQNSASASLLLKNANGPALSLSLSMSDVDKGADTTATITRNTSSTDPLVVDLSVSDPTKASVPLTVAIPADQASVSFTVAAIDDHTPDGLQQVQISATAAGFDTGSRASGDYRCGLAGPDGFQCVRPSRRL